MKHHNIPKGLKALFKGLKPSRKAQTCFRRALEAQARPSCNNPIFARLFF